MFPFDKLQKTPELFRNAEKRQQSIKEGLFSHATPFENTRQAPKNMEGVLFSNAFGNAEQESRNTGGGLFTNEIKNNMGTGLFGKSFGNAEQAQKNMGSGLFGGGGLFGNAEQVPRNMGGGLFDNAFENLFSNAEQVPKNMEGGFFANVEQESRNTGGGLFANETKNNMGTGLFGKSFGKAEQVPRTTGNRFFGNGGLFGNAGQVTRNMGGGLFGNAEQVPKNIKCVFGTEVTRNMGGGLFENVFGNLFDNAEQVPRNMGGGLFDNAGQAPKNMQGRLFDNIDVIENVDDTQIQKVEAQRSQLLEAWKRLIEKKDKSIEENDKLLDSELDKFKKTIENAINEFCQKAKEELLYNNLSKKEYFDSLEKKIKYLETLDFTEGNDVKKIQTFNQEAIYIKDDLEFAENIVTNHRIQPSYLEENQQDIIYILKNMRSMRQ